MAHIIAGHFQQQEQLAVEKLVGVGFSTDQISSFYVNPPGQHDLYIVGGDRDISPGAKESGHGVVVGAASGGGTFNSRDFI